MKGHLGGHVPLPTAHCPLEGIRCAWNEDASVPHYKSLCGGGGGGDACCRYHYYSILFKRSHDSYLYTRTSVTSKQSAVADDTGDLR